MPIYPIHSPIQHYAWGSTSSIPEITGQKNPENLPWAEMWMGAHPKAPSTVAGKTLASLLQRRGDPPLPFLFKILAAQSALSIQCHPDKSQAEVGFAREESAEIPIDAPNRNYRDRNHKPELIVALSDFWALKGFRQPRDIVELFERAGLSAADSLLRTLSEYGLRDFFSGLLGLEQDQKNAILSQLKAGLKQLPPSCAQWTQELLTLYPGDIGACSTLILQLVHLAPGDALFLGPGELHAYLRGTGLELMASSDNVLRGGLTTKHVDTAELARILRFDSSPVQVLRPTPVAGTPLYHYDSVPGLQLHFTDLHPTREAFFSPHASCILLSIGGNSQLRYGGATLELVAGQAALCTSDVHQVSACGRGRLWIASSPAQ